MARLSKERKAEIRQEILDTSKTMFYENGYDKTSTRKIAKTVGIAEGTIFNYFDTKADIFLEVIGSDMEEFPIDGNIDWDTGVTDIIYEFLVKSVSFFTKLNKGIMREMAVATVNIAKKAPNVLRKFAELDYKVLADLEKLLAKLQEQGLITQCDVKLTSEVLYSVTIFDLCLYVYEDDYLIEDALERSKTKIAFVMKGYTVN